MATTIKGTKKQARKRHRQSLIRRTRNRAVRSRVRNQMRSLRAAATEGEGDIPAQLVETQATIDNARRLGILHRNTANRYKARLARQAAKAQATQGA